MSIYKHMKYHQGKYKVKNLQKYIGDPTNVFYRSGWEQKAFCYFDMNPEIIKWGSEEIIIPYISPVDGRYHRYFPDVWIKTSNGDKFLIEIKPFKQTIEPEKKSRVTKKYITEVMTYGINKAKWTAAEQYCKKKGWKFMLLTEKELYK